MRTGYLIAQRMKEIKSPSGNDRLARAMFVAHAIAFHLPLNMQMTHEEFADQNMKFFRDILNSVNENVAVDTKMAQELFKTLTRIRYELVLGIADPSLVQAAFCSQTSQDNMTTGEFTMAQWLASRSEFIKVQTEVSEILAATEREG
jgi:hypothetical protein